ncbi:MAG: hypothetical protein LLG04_12410, partial [Parachlamydia sp.]|nr:hypothetical protein [Parachlamydia sp.]
MSRFRMLLTLVLMTTIFPQLPANLMQSDIEHVVVLMLENRSFDNLLAWVYCKDLPCHFLPAGTDPHYTGLSESTLSQYTNVLRNAAGQTVYSCPPIKGIPSVATSPYLNSPAFDPYEPFPHVILQIFGSPTGKTPVMTGFLQDYASHWVEEEWLSQKKTICAVMETYTEKQLPILCGLARHYAISDQWFSSVPTQTNPNRAFAACGTSEGQVVNGPLGKSTFYADTIWNRLTDLSPDTSWMIFWQSDMLPGIFPGPYTSPNIFANMANIPELASHYAKIDSFHEMARNGQLPSFSFIEPQLTTSVHVGEEPRTTQEMVDMLTLLGVQGNDYHPPGDVRTAENQLANIYTSLIANPEAWSKTLLIVTFDEHGGLFDHVPPPAAIPPDNLSGEGFHFDSYGVRVPALFISPRIAKRTILRSNNPSIPFDHTSLISTILTWQNMNPSQWNMGKRAAAAPTFDSVITLKKPRQDAILIPPKKPLPPSNNIIQFGDSFYLKDASGNYLSKSSFF